MVCSERYEVGLHNRQASLGGPPPHPAPRRSPGLTSPEAHLPTLTGPCRPNQSPLTCLSLTRIRTLEEPGPEFAFIPLWGACGAAAPRQSLRLEPLCSTPPTLQSTPASWCPRDHISSLKDEAGGAGGWAGKAPGRTGSGWDRLPLSRKQMRRPPCQ